MTAIVSTNTVKPRTDDKSHPLRHVRVDDVKPAVFDFNRQFKDEKKPHPSAYGHGPIQTAMLRDMAENKVRLAASAAKKAIRAAMPDAPLPPAKRKGRARKAR